MKLIDELEATSRGERDAVVSRAAELTGKSKVTIYRHLKKCGWSSGRKSRADKGSSDISDAELATIASIMRATDRNNGKQLASAALATEIAAANGLAAREYHPATVARRLRESGMSAKQMRRATPHVMLASAHPNHMWQVDPSFCVLYYLKEDKGMAVMDEAQFYKNKPANFAKIANERVLRYVCVDHCTGAFYCRYYNVSGENAETMFDFLMRAMGNKDKQHNPFEGVPRILYWDKGSANQSALIRSLLDGLGIEHHAHVKGNSRAKGSVEQHNNIIEKNFEARLIFANIRSIDQLNSACEAWQRRFQNTQAHTRHGMTRFAAWRKISAEQFVARPPLEICRLLLTGKADKRKVGGNYQISYAVPGYGSRQYRVAEVDNVRIGETVEVRVNPYAAPSIWVSHPDAFGQVKRYEIAPLTVNEWGFTEDAVAVDGHFQQAPLTAVDRNRQHLDEIAWGTRDAQEVDKRRNTKSEPAFGGSVDAIDYLAKEEPSKVLPMPRSGKPLQVTAEPPKQIDVNPLFVPAAAPVREERLLPVIEFIRWAAERMEMTPQINADIRASYPDGLPESAYESALAALQRSVVKASLKVIA